MNSFKRTTPFVFLFAILLAFIVIQPASAEASCKTKVGAYTPSLLNGRVSSLGTAKACRKYSNLRVFLIQTRGSKVLAYQSQMFQAPQTSVRVITKNVRWRGCREVFTKSYYEGYNLSGSGAIINQIEINKLSKPRMICLK
jgi:hypothetical protein